MAGCSLESDRGGVATAPRGQWQPPRANPLLAPRVAAVIEHCVQHNVAIRLPPADGAQSPVGEEVQFALHLAVRVLETANTKKNVALLAPTAPRARAFYAASTDFKSLKACCLIGDIAFESDSWEHTECQQVLDRHDVLVSGPSLLKDALDQQFVRLSQFCLIVFDTCRLCISSHPPPREGRHPYAAILRQLRRDMLPPGSVRLVGFDRVFTTPRITSQSDELAWKEALAQAIDGAIHDWESLAARHRPPAPDRHEPASKWWEVVD